MDDVIVHGGKRFRADPVESPESAPALPERQTARWELVEVDTDGRVNAVVAALGGHATKGDATQAARRWLWNRSGG